LTEQLMLAAVFLNLTHKTKAEAEKQGRAIRAAGYKGKK